MTIGNPTIEYAIDSTPVPGGPWRHRVIPRRPAGQRVDGIPGVAQHFVTTGVLMPGGLMIMGMLLAADQAALKALLDGYSEMVVDYWLHTVTHHDVVWQRMYLMEVEPTGDVTGIVDDAFHKLGQDVTFTWRQLRA